jgi:hypothetical protein
MTRIIPDFRQATAHWEHASSDIPDYLTVPLSDGRVMRFYPDLKPGFVRREDGTVGYVSRIFPREE